jgi:hypothetical protein
LAEPQAGRDRHLSFFDKKFRKFHANISGTFYLQQAGPLNPSTVTIIQLRPEEVKKLF